MVTILSANYPRKAKTCVTVFDAILAQVSFINKEKHKQKKKKGET